MSASHGERAGAARRRRERRQRSWWRHEQLSVAAALTSARHHSAGPVVVEHETHDGLRAQNTPPPGTQPGVLQDPGPSWVEAVTVGYVAARPPSLTVVPVSDDRIDDATLQFLLQQSLLARAEEEEQAREEAEVKELEDDVALKEGRLLVVLERDHRLLSTGFWQRRRLRRGRRGGGESGTGLGS